MPKQLDLRQVNPAGRIDVLAYKAAEKLTGYLEERTGLQGVWPAIEQDIQKLVVRGLGQVEVSPEVRILLVIMQANMIKDHICQQQTK